MHLAPRTAAAAALGFALLASARASLAEEQKPRTASLSWVRLPGAESCVGVHDLAQAVETWLGRSLFVTPSTADLAIEARIERAKKTGWKATVRATTSDGRVLGDRELTKEGSDCRKIDDELVLVLALTIDPDAEPASAKSASKTEDPKPPVASPKAEPSPAKEIVRTERVLVPIASPSPERDASKPKKPWAAEGEVAFTISGGLLPGPTPGVAAFARFDVPGFLPVELSGNAWPGRDASAAQQGAHLSLFTGGLALCPSLSPASFLRVAACAGVEAGAMTAHGFGFDHALDGTEALVDATVGGRLSLRLYRGFFATAGVRAIAPLVRPRFFSTGPTGVETDVYATPPLAGAASLGLGLRFPS